MRKIIHIDMDAFFASIEQRDRPELRGRPVVVGGSPERRGVVSTCSYEARVFGLHSAMPMKTALRLCPQAVLLDVDMKKYRRESAKIREIFHRYTDLVEPVSIDEAYLDVTENRFRESSATKLARAIQREIFAATGLTASAGVSYNKFLAKIASDARKPAGLTVIPPEKALAYLDTLPVGKFHGIGRVSAAKLTGMNIRTGHELRQLDAVTLKALFGKTGLFYYNIVRGIDNRPVEVKEEPKSVGHEITLAEDCTNMRALRIMMRQLSHRVAHRLQAKNLAGKTVTVKVRYENFETVTRSFSAPAPVCDGMEIGEIALALAAKTEWATRPIRLLGVTVGNFVDPGADPGFEQLLLPFA
ncbi:DNA polymerase IV [uncultured Victivallis sp.]|uniref:DNA polymerase IV n=1 Tax=uncultured Victivallis sp. TaxID=354118 RepID=UPI0025CFEED2|nr:DNA polymerase IV [uncultured Victivallis sp.]